MENGYVLAEAAADVRGLLAAFQAFQGQNERLTSRLVKKYGVGETELRALLVLGVHGDLTLKQLGLLTDQLPSKITFLVDRLERAAYAMRVPNPDDRRSQNVCLTSEGGAVVESVRELYRGVFEHAVGRRDVRRLSDIFGDLSRAISDEVA
jgi:DNA-binding MarR family transcriptional regulator